MEDLNQYNYEIKVPHDDDPSSSLIEKSNVKVEFTLAQLLQEIYQAKKLVEQIEAQKNHEQMKMDNVAKFYPKVLKLTEEERFRIHMYQDAFAVVDQANKKLPEIQEEIGFMEAEVKHVCEKLKIDLSPNKPVDWKNAVDDLVKEDDNKEENA